jgi:DNA-binding beta-propeller fold protein YncE
MLQQPAGVAASGGAYFVIDRGTPRILRLDQSGQLQAVLDLQALSTYGLNGLTVDANGDIYAADTGRNRILVFTPTGQLLKEIGHAGNDLGGFTQPMMLAFAPDGSFFVADWENSRVERFDASYQATDSWSTGFRPFGVAVDALGRVYAPDADQRRVDAYTPTGGSLGEIGASSGGPALDVSPRQLAFAVGQSSLYVLGSDAIQRLDLQNTAPPPQAAPSVDLLSVLVILLMAALVVIAVVSRRGLRRGSLAATLDGPVGLNAEDGAERQHQQADADQELLIAHQTKGKQ